MSASLNFTIQEGSETSLSGNISGSSTATDSASITGNYTADVVFDPDTLVVKSFTFTGGNIFLGDLDLTISGNVNVIGFGNAFLSVTARARDLRETISTPTPPGTVLPSGALIASEHAITVNRGTLTLIANALGQSETEVTNYSVSPESSAANGSVTISVTRSATTDFEEMFVFTLVTETTEFESETIEGTRNTLTLEGEESTTSKASLSLRTDLGEWLDTQSLAENEFDSTNASGLPYWFLYVFDLDANALRLPISPAMDSEGDPVVLVTLPVTGLRADLAVQYRSSLSGGEWLSLPSANILGETSFPLEGASGTVTLSYPDGVTGFIRLTDDSAP